MTASLTDVKVEIPGRLEYWNTGILEDWNTGILSCSPSPDA
jgi:hypothetical protein